MPKLCLIVLGCPKNIVEGELIAGVLSAHGIALTTDVNAADVALVHTCSFIADARGESVAAIRKLERLKARGRLRRIFVSGCFVQAEGEDVLAEFPSVDGWIGTGELERIPELLQDGTQYIKTAPGGFLESAFPRLLSSRLPSAYLRVSEGCNHRCSFCIIPRLRGRYKSRSLESVISEARALVRAGVREINLIAQDTSCYGLDLYGRAALPEMLKELGAIPALRWIRIMYAFPSTVTGELIEAVGREKKVCRYIDMPLQHASARVLRSMCRPVGVRKLLERLRRKVPDIALRTSFIVGFPGETERDFDVLADLVAEGWFEQMGVFEFSPYPGTPASCLPHQVPEALKRARKERLMLLQQNVVMRRNRERAGSVHEVFVETVNKGGSCSGRTAFQAPEIDGRVVFRGAVSPGSFVKVLVTGARGYDLTGVQLDGKGTTKRMGAHA